MRTTLIGTPYLTQTEVKEDENRQIYSRVYTTNPDAYKQASDDEIAEVQNRILQEQEAEQEAEQLNELY